MDQCPICRYPFDPNFRLPMELCRSQHFCCNSCSKQILKKTNKCPECREQLNENTIKKWRFFDIWFEKDNREKEQERQIQILKKLTEIYKKVTHSLISIILKNENQTNALMDLKDKALNENDFDSAAIIIRNLIQRQPNAKDDFIGLGSKEEENGFSEKKGFEWYQNRYKVSKLSLYDQLALCHMKSPNYNEQKEWYQRILEKDPTNFKTLYGLALTEHNHGNKDKAIELYQKIIDINPTFDKPDEMIGFIRLSQEDQGSAHLFAHVSITKNPDNIFAELIFAVGANLKVFKFFPNSKLLEINNKQPTYVRPFLQMGKFYLENKLYEQALENFNKCLLINNDYFDGHILKAKALYKLKKGKQAQSILKAIDINQLTKLQQVQYYKLLGNMHYDQKQYIESGLAFKKCCLLNPLDAQIHQQLGNLYYLKFKNYKLAATEYQFCWNLNQNNIEFIQKIYFCYFTENRYEDSIKWLEKWMQLQPKNMEPFMLISQAYFQMKKYKNSVCFGSICLRNMYKINKVSLLIVKALYENKQYDECMKRIQQIRRQYDAKLLDYEKMQQIKLKANCLIFGKRG